MAIGKLVSTVRIRSQQLECEYLMCKYTHETKDRTEPFPEVLDYTTSECLYVLAIKNYASSVSHQVSVLEKEGYQNNDSLVSRTPIC